MDLTRVLAGPFCTMILSDLGAEVFKVEIPGRGDDTRRYPPFVGGVSSYYLSLNRGKKSITLNLKTREGVEVLHRLASKVDVVVENFRPGVTGRLGVDYGSLSKLNPGLVYCSISSFGQTGPYAQWPGYDLIIQGMSGLMGITGEEGGDPVRVGVAVEDINAGLHGVIAILAALWVREKTGVGQYIDLSMLDAGVSWMTYVAGNYFATGRVPPKMGSAHPSIVPYQAFKAGDGRFILVAAGNDRLFKALCGVLGLEELAEDPRFSTNEARVQNKGILVPLIQERFLEASRDEWLYALREAGFPCGPVYTIDEVFQDPQVIHRDMRVEMEHPQAGTITQIGTPFKFSHSQTGPATYPPLLGEHTVEVLTDFLGYSLEEVERLRSAGAI